MFCCSGTFSCVITKTIYCTLKLAKTPGVKGKRQQSSMSQGNNMSFPETELLLSFHVQVITVCTRKAGTKGDVKISPSLSLLLPSPRLNNRIIVCERTLKNL